MRKISIKIISLFCSWFCLHVLIISADGLMDEKQQADLGVVLGNKIELDGMPSERLRYRLEKAVELYRKGYFPGILVSGGIGSEGYDESQIMKQYLIDKGIPADKILMDHHGLNTRMTAQNTKKIMDSRKLTSVMVITQFYHISRTKLAFYKLGIDDVYSASADYFERRDIYSTFREFFAYYQYLFFEKFSDNHAHLRLDQTKNV